MKECCGRSWAGAVYRETQLVIPTTHLGKFLDTLHGHLGHVGAIRLLLLWERKYVASDDQVKDILETLTLKCRTCSLGKPNRPEDRGIQGSLALPAYVNAEVALDLIYPCPDCVALFMMCTLSKFCQVCLLDDTSHEAVAQTYGESGLFDMVRRGGSQPTMVFASRHDKTYGPRYSRHMGWT